MNPVRVRCVVHGRVQGVYFRAATQQQAQRLGLTGWVRNCSDGTVEVEAEGEPTHVQQLVEWCQHGPPGAYVTHLETTWDEAAGHWTAFEICY
jgi:acylphosphatase